MNETTQAPGAGRAGTIDVPYVARLARLRLAPDETARYQAQLDHVIAHVRQLQALDVGDVEPTAHALPAEGRLRADEPGACQPTGATLANAPAARDGLFVVPRILE